MAWSMKAVRDPNHLINIARAGAEEINVSALPDMEVTRSFSIKVCLTQPRSYYFWADFLTRHLPPM